MATTINSNTTDGLVITPDTSGEISFQSNGTTVAGINSTGLTGDGSQLTGISSYSDSDALSLFNASGSAPVYACRAWVNFNGTGTVAIRGSGNVSSITDNGVGKYAVNLTTAMSDTNYSVSGACANQTTPTTQRDREFQAVASSTSVVNVNIYVQTDMAYISLQVFR